MLFMENRIKVQYVKMFCLFTLDQPCTKAYCLIEVNHQEIMLEGVITLKLFYLVVFTKNPSQCLVYASWW